MTQEDRAYIELLRDAQKAQGNMRVLVVDPQDQPTIAKVKQMYSCNHCKRGFCHRASYIAKYPFEFPDII